MKDVRAYANRVIHGDCIEVMREMPEQSVDLIVTDPPYLVRYRSRDGRSIANDNNDRWLKPSFAEMHRVLKPNAYAISFYGWGQADKFMTAWREAGFRPIGHFVFAKDYSSKTGHTRATHENAYLLAKGKPTRPDNAPRDVLDWQYTGNHFHPTQKPVSALTPLIEAYSKPGDVVLDPFAGSGTTAVAARQLGRQYVAIEKDPVYFEAAQKRLGGQSQTMWAKYGAGHVSQDARGREQALER